MSDVNAYAASRAYHLKQKVNRQRPTIRGKEMTDKKVKKSAGGNGQCCPYCADSKYPCVKMEKASRSGGTEKKQGADKG